MMLGEIIDRIASFERRLRDLEGAVLYGTVTQASPFKIRLDGDTDDMSPSAAFDPAGLSAGTRVVCLKRGRELIALGAVASGASAGGLPPGAVQAFATTAAPSGWLVCDGSAVSRATYAALFTAIGTTYGSGNGSTTFNVPNLKGRVIVGKDAGDSSFDTLGETGGAKTHTLTISEMPRHNHEITDLATGTLNSSSYAKANQGGTYYQKESGYAGGDGAHNNLQPYIVLLSCIKT